MAEWLDGLMAYIQRILSFVQRWLAFDKFFPLYKDGLHLTNSFLCTKMAYI